jgi:hypothetical protein
VSVEHAEIARFIATSSLQTNRAERPNLLASTLNNLSIGDMTSVMLQLGDLIDMIYSSWQESHRAHGAEYDIPDWERLMLWATQQDGKRR